MYMWTYKLAPNSAKDMFKNIPNKTSNHFVRKRKHPMVNREASKATRRELNYHAYIFVKQYKMH